MTIVSESKNNHVYFVDYIFEQCERSKGLAAKLRRADNPDTEYQSWGVLVAFHVDLNFESKRLAYALVAAAIAKAVKHDHTENGMLSLGSAISKTFRDPTTASRDDDSPGAARLGRLLACRTTKETCHILRPLLGLIQSRITTTLDYAELLGNLLRFEYHPQAIKARWAQQFYRTNLEEPHEGGV